MPIPQSSLPPGRNLLRNDVYSRLRDAIVDGTLAPGEQLRDRDLALWLGVSRTPVREALLRLHDTGLVAFTPGRSTTVTPLDIRATEDARGVVAAMHGLAARAAVPLMTADDLERMRTANARFSRAIDVGDADEALAADDELHGIPVTVAGNAATRAVLDRLMPLLRRVELSQFASLAGHRSVDLHIALIDRCAAGDADGAVVVSYETWETLDPLLST